MEDIRIKDFDELNRPNRMPWLLLILAAVIIAFFVARRSRKPAKSGLPAPAQTAETTTARPANTITPQPVSADAATLVSEGRKFEAADKLPEARRQYLDALKQLSPGTVRTDVENRLARINIQLVTTPLPMPEKITYVVERGDSIERIAREFGTTVELVQKSNMIKNKNIIKAGDRILVLKALFAIQTSKDRNDLILLMNDEFFKRYRVGTGKYDKTPEGTFEISERIPEPVWWRPDGKEIPYTGKPDGENILGTRWMTLRATGETPRVKGYGIHGTWDNSSIGKAESAGCIRMINEDVEELFILVPEGTPVVITD